MGQGRDENLEGEPAVQIGQGRVQAMDAFHEHDGLGRYPDFLVHPADTDLEIIDRHLDFSLFLDIQDLLELLVEEFPVNGLQAFKVVVPVGIPGSLFPIHEIVVQRDFGRAVAQYLQLDREPFAEGGLARGGRPADEHDAAIRFLGHGIGDAGYFLLLQGFGELDQAACPFLLQNPVEVAYVRHAHDFQPVFLFLESLEKLAAALAGRLDHIRQEPPGVFPYGLVQVRTDGNQAVAEIAVDMEMLDIARAGY